MNQIEESWSDCVPCSCNDRSTKCNSQTGICLDCQHGTEGDSCERCQANVQEPDCGRCAPGYYGYNDNSFAGCKGMLDRREKLFFLPINLSNIVLNNSQPCYLSCYLSCYPCYLLCYACYLCYLSNYSFHFLCYSFYLLCYSYYLLCFIHVTYLLLITSMTFEILCNSLIHFFPSSL